MVHHMLVRDWEGVVLNVLLLEDVSNLDFKGATKHFKIFVRWAGEFVGIVHDVCKLLE